MAQTTLYDIKLRYQMEDRATRPMRAMASQVDRTAKRTRFLGTAMGKIGAVAAGYFGLRTAGKALIGFNANMEQARIQIAGMISQTTSKGWTDSLSLSNDLVGKLQERAKRSVGTTKDMVDMASMIVRPISQAGLGMKELEDFTAGSVVAARAFGIQSDMAARDIESALMGQLRSVDRFARALLEPMGVVGEEGRRAFNEMDAASRAAMLKSALTSDAINAMAKAQENSFSGVYSTFQDNLQIFLGKVGKPLFKGLTEEVRSWNEYIEQNAVKLEEIGRTLASGVMKAFTAMREAVGFVVRHKSLFMGLAKLALLAKGVKLAAGPFASIMAGFTRVGAGAGAAGSSLFRFSGGMTEVVGRLGRAASILGGVAVGAKAIADYVDRQQEKKITRKTVDSFTIEGAQALAGMEGGKQDTRRRGASARADRWKTRGEGIEGLRYGYQVELAKDVLTSAKGAGIIEGGQVNVRRMMQRYDTGGMFDKATSSKDMIRILEESQIPLTAGGRHEDAQNAIQAMRGLERALDYQALQQGKMMMAAGGPLGQLIQQAVELGEKQKAAAGPDLGKLKKPAKMNVTIQRIEAKSEDPDRFVFALAETLEDVARTGSYRGGM